jgi:hypothetical protein
MIIIYIDMYMYVYREEKYKMQIVSLRECLLFLLRLVKYEIIIFKAIGFFELERESQSIKYTCNII